MRQRLLGWSLAALLVGGCASTAVVPVNDYARFYRGEPWATPSTIEAMRETRPTGPPDIVHVERYDESIAALYARQGYVLIGESDFASESVQADQGAIHQGVAVGADLVVIVTPERRAVTAADSADTRAAGASRPSSIATAYGALGRITAYGASATTADGSASPFAPAVVPGSEYSAGYFVKKRYHFGVQSRDLTDSEREALPAEGVYVGLVVDHSPADAAGILSADVILAVNGQAAQSQAGLAALIDAHRGETVDITIIRAGRTLSKRVSILE